MAKRYRMRWVATSLVACAVLLGSSRLDAAKTIVVTSTADRPTPRAPAPAGSLREAVERLAQAGDTITFNVTGPVKLEAPLQVPPGLNGLTIEGPATIAGGSRGVLEILAFNVTLRGLSFTDVNVVAGSERVDPIGFFARSNTFNGTSTLTVKKVLACEVERNTFDVSTARDSISLDRTQACRVSRNVISGPAHWQIADQDSIDLFIDHNQLSGGLRTTQRSGLITENHLEGTGRIRINSSGLPDSGLLRVVRNTAPELTAERTNLEISDNTLTPAAGETTPALLKVLNFDPLAPAGGVLIAANKLRGGRTAIHYTETPTSVPGVITRNIIDGCSGKGVLVRSGLSPQVEYNQVSDCDVGIDIDGAMGRVDVDSNTVLRARRAGIQVLDVADLVFVHDNTVRLGLAEGVFIQGGAGRTFLQDNTITGNAGAGVLVGRASRANVFRDEITSNGGAGVLVRADALVAINQIAASLNAGPGIDIVPLGVTPNSQLKNANLDLDWPENLVWSVDLLTGTAAPGSLVDIYVVEPAPRAGNPRNGEGLTYLGSSLAGASGRFEARLACVPGLVLTTTATLPTAFPTSTDPMARTSEFSEDVTCTVAPPPFVDADQDGVSDDIDQCLGTPPGEPVDGAGCSASQRDTDGDGVTDNLDVCPGTAPGAPVDESGCSAPQRDDDGDGVANGVDRCPYSEPASPVNADGCAVTVEIPGTGVAYCARADTCRVTPEQGGDCEFCSIVREDSLVASCIDRGRCSLAPDGYLESDGGLLFGRRSLFDCDGGECDAPPNAPVSCSAGAGGCRYTADTASSSCPADAPCTIVVDAPLLLDTTIATEGEFVVWLKHLVGFDAPKGITLTYRSSVDGEPRAERSLNATPGAPSPALQYHIVASPAPATYEFEQRTDQPTVLESIDCGGNGSVDPAGRRVRFEVAGALDVSCLFKLTVPAAVTITSLHVARPFDLVVGTDRATATLSTQATDSAGSTRDVTADPDVVYTSSDPSVIEVSNSPGSRGVITAKRAGEVTLRAGIAASEDQPAVESSPVAARAGDVLVAVPAVLPFTSDGQPYLAVVSAIGGLGPLTFTLAEGSAPLPPGLTLNGSTGEITGTASAGGDYLPTIRIRDSSNPPQFANYSSFLLVLKLPPMALPGGRAGEAYPETFFDAVGVVRGDTQGVYTVVAGTVPPGLVFENLATTLPQSRGRLSGTPTAAGTYTFTVEVRDEFDGRTDTQQYTVVIEEGETQACAVSAAGTWGDACGANPDSFSFGSIGGSCQDCRGAHVSGASFVCAAGQTCTLSDFFLLVQGGSIGGPAGSLDCAGATCDVANARVSCDGPAGACTLSVPPNPITACPDDVSCHSQFPLDRLLTVDAGPQHSLEIRKTTTAPADNATFEFEIRDQLLPSPLFSQTASVTTGGGVGTRALVFPGLGAEHDISFREIVPAGWELLDVSCPDRGFTWDRASNLIKLGTLSGLTSSSTHCSLVNRKRPVGVVRPTGTTLPEAANETRTFGLPPGNRITIAGSNGFEIRDAITDQIPTAGNRLLSFHDIGNFNKFGALVVKHPSGNGSDALFTHGSGGYGVSQFFPSLGDFGATQVSFPPGQNITDATYFGDDPDAAGVLWVNFTRTRVRANVWRDSGGLFFAEAGPDLVSSFNVGSSTGMVSAFTFDLKFDADGALRPESTGWVATVLDGTPGQLWISDPKLPSAAGTFVGNLGNSPRRIRCLVSHNLCAVSNFASDSLTIVQWNGRETAAITATRSVGDGPVGIDIRADGVNAKVISTGFNDNTVTVTTVGPGGNVLASVTQAVPAGCVNPGHALWLSGVPVTAVLTCKGSDSYSLIAP